MENKVVVLIVGLRNQGRAHVPAFRADRRVEVAVCDMDPKQAAQVGQQHRIPKKRRFGGPNGYADALRVLQPSVVVLATPTHTHYELSVQAAQAGVGVILCEKPLATDAIQARRLLDRVAAHGSRLFVGFHMRYMHGAVATVLSNRGAGYLHSIVMEWFRLFGRPELGPAGYPGGPILMDLGSHFIDLALSWLGHPDVSYVAGVDQQPREDTDVFDRYGGLIVCSSGQTIDLKMAYKARISSSERASGEVTGNRGELFVPIMTARDDNPEKFLPSFNAEAFGVPFDSAALGREVLPLNPMACFTAQATDVVTVALGGDSATLCTGEDAYQVVRIVDALAASAKNRKPVMFDEERPAAEQPEG